MASVHLIVGEDDFLVSEAAKKIVGDGVGLEVVDSLQSTNAEMQLNDLRSVDASFSTPPFLDPRRLTWWKNVHFLPHQGGRATAEDVREALEKFAEKVAKAQPDENQQLLITGPSMMKTSRFAKILSGVAEVVSFAKGKPWEEARNAAMRVVELAAELNLRFDRGVAERFVSRVGTDSRSLINELGKMRDYLGGRDNVVTMAAVNEITSQGVGVEPEVWAITDALGERNLEKALLAAMKFEKESGFAVLVTSVVEKFYRQLIDMKNGVAPEMNPYTLRKMQGYLNNYSLGELRLARWRFLILREKVVSGVSEDTGNELAINELVRACRRERG